MTDFEKERDEQLIKERQDYEDMFFEQVIEEMLHSEACDELFEKRIEYIEDNFDLKQSPDNQMLEKYDPYSDLSKEKEYHYDEIPQECYDALLDEIFVKDDLHLKELIKEHVREEDNFIDSILMEVIQEDAIFQRAIDETIFEKYDMDYDEQEWDYDEPEYWYSSSPGECWPPDESVVDPFDSFDEIDYPEGNEPNYDLDEYLSQKYQEEYYPDEEMEREIELQIEEYEMVPDDADVFEKDYEKYLKSNNPPEPSQVKIDEYVDVDELRNQEMIEIHDKVKNHFKQQDKLTQITKEKIKQRKFRK